MGAEALYLLVELITSYSTDKIVLGALHLIYDYHYTVGSAAHAHNCRPPLSGAA